MASDNSQSTFQARKDDEPAQELRLESIGLHRCGSRDWRMDAAAKYHSLYRNSLLSCRGRFVRLRSKAISSIDGPLGGGEGDGTI